MHSNESGERKCLNGKRSVLILDSQVPSASPAIYGNRGRQNKYIFIIWRSQTQQQQQTCHFRNKFTTYFNY